MGEILEKLLEPSGMEKALPPDARKKKQSLIFYVNTKAGSFL
jgi:hypothetical protein